MRRSGEREHARWITARSGSFVVASGILWVLGGAAAYALVRNWWVLRELNATPPVSDEMSMSYVFVQMPMTTWEFIVLFLVLIIPPLLLGFYWRAGRSTRR